MPNVYHVVPRDSEWAIKLEGRSEAVRVFASREPAVREADSYIRRQGAGRVVIHRETGEIESVHTVDTLPAETDWVHAITSRPALAVGLAAVCVGVGIAIARRRG